MSTLETRLVYLLEPRPPNLQLPASIYEGKPGFVAASKRLVGVGHDIMQIHRICNGIRSRSLLAGYAIEPGIVNQDEHGNYFTGLYPCRQVVRKYGEYDPDDEFPSFLKACEYISPAQEALLRKIHEQWPYKKPLGPSNPTFFQEWMMQIRALKIVEMDSDMPVVLMGLFLREI